MSTTRGGGVSADSPAGKSPSWSMPSGERAINAVYGFDAGWRENIAIKAESARLKAARAARKGKPVKAPKKSQWCRTAGH